MIKQLFVPMSMYYLIMLSAWSAGKSDDKFDITFETTDKGVINATVYGEGDHAVVLAHGAIFNKESWGFFAKN